MWDRLPSGQACVMTTTFLQTDSGSLASPPLARIVQVALGVSLVLAGVLNGLSQYLGHLLAGDLEMADQMRWWVEHPREAQLEQLALVTSALFMPFGLLGLAQVTRWCFPRLTVVATILVLWGMWGFHNILAMGYVSVYVAARVQTFSSAVGLNEAVTADPGVWAVALVPHLVGSFLGLLLLSVACWRSGQFPRTPLVLLVVFLVWDFLLPPVGPLEPHLLLVVSWVWLGVHLVRMPSERWRGLVR